ncbi:UPF0496 protein At4g34320-like [Cornus florida]|uniref:UPF0496 protein At4g34320-like n=1 Tax=Cornus florida TaxID=4283 RepID=UPI0028A2CAA0|nr:UPF0496 protein At4g34320-like [Cornus florida]
MGVHSSKVKEQHLDVEPEFSSYDAACQIDPYLKAFDSALQQNTTGVINTFAEGVEGRPLSLDSLKVLTDSFLKMNQQAGEHILQCKIDIVKNDDLRDVGKDYFDNSFQTLKFCNALEKCLKRARDSQVMIGGGLQQFEKEQRQGSDGNRKIYLKTLQELKKFKNAGNPFTEEFFSLLKSVYENQKLMLEKLKAKKSELDKKLKEMKTWRTVKNVILGLTVASLVICFVVVVAIYAPNMATALVASVVTELGTTGSVTSTGFMMSLGKAAMELIGTTSGVVATALTGLPAAAAGFGAIIVCTDSLCMKYEDELKAQREIISSLEGRTEIAVAELENINLSMEKLEGEIESMLKNADLDLTEEAAVVLAMDAIKEELNKFTQTIKSFSKHIDDCSRHIMTAREEILEEIIKYRSRK